MELENINRYVQVFDYLRPAALGSVRPSRSGFGRTLNIGPLSGMPNTKSPPARPRARAYAWILAAIRLVSRAAGTRRPSGSP